MSYEDIVTIIFVAVHDVKKEVIVHRPKTPPKQSLDWAPSTWIALEWAILPANSSSWRSSSLCSRHSAFGWRSGSPLR